MIDSDLYYKTIKIIVAVFLAVLVLIFYSSPHESLNQWTFTFFGGFLSLTIAILFDEIVKNSKEKKNKQFNSIINLTRKANYLDMALDNKHDSSLVKEAIERAIEGNGKEIQILGTTLNSILGEKGLLTKRLIEKKAKGKVIKM